MVALPQLRGWSLGYRFQHDVSGCQIVVQKRGLLRANEFRAEEAVFDGGHWFLFRLTFEVRLKVQLAAL